MPRYHPILASHSSVHAAVNSLRNPHHDFPEELPAKQFLIGLLYIVEVEYRIDYRL